MAATWTTTVDLLPADQNIGVATVTFSGDADFPAGSPFTYSRRCTVNGGDAAAFKAEAIAALAVERARRQRNVSLNGQLTTLMNT